MVLAPDPTVGEAVAVTPRSGARRRPLAVHPATVVLIGACAALVHLGMSSGLNTDAFWHLASGRWMLAHHRVLRHDVLSYTVHGRSWTNAEWGFDVLLAWMVAHVGPVSYWLLSGGATAAALVAGAIRWRRQGASNLWTAALVVMATATMSVGVATRPQDLSYLLFALELLILASARANRRWLLALGPLLIVWANVHGSFLAGVGVVALEAVIATAATVAAAGRRPAGSRPERQLTLGRVAVTTHLRAQDAWLAVAGVVAAASCNPHGPALFLYDLRVSGAPQLASIEEWQSPNFHDPVVLATIGLPILVGVACLALARWRVEAFDLILWLGLLVFTLRAVRFAPYLALALGGLLAGGPVLRRETIRPGLFAWPVGALLAGSVLALPHPPPGTIATTGSLANPVKATAWLQHRPGRVFSTYAWNDYLDHVGIPVFVDGRTDLYFGTPVLSEYDAVAGLSVAPDPVLARYDVRWVLWPAHQPLSLYLARDPHWALRHRVGTDLVFERVSAPPAR